MLHLDLNRHLQESLQVPRPLMTIWDHSHTVEIIFKHALKGFTRLGEIFTIV